MKNTILVFILITFSCSSVAAQLDKGLQVMVFSGVSGDAKRQDPTYESFETRFTYDAGLAFGGGGYYQARFSSHLGWRLGIVYENANFTRNEFYEYFTFRNELRSGDIKRTFQNHSILIPALLLWRKGKWGFNLGINTNIHLSTQMRQEHIFYLESIEVQSFTQRFKSGTFNATDLGDWERISLEDTFNFQWSFGLVYRLFPRLEMDLSINDFIRNNSLVQEVNAIDVVGTYSRDYDAFAQRLSLGFSWQL